MYAMSLKRFPLKAALDSPPVVVKGGLTKEYSPMLKIGYAINRIQTFFYINFYYYFNLHFPKFHYKRKNH